MCYLLFYYPAICGPRGHDSGLPLPLRTAATIFPLLTISCPRSKLPILTGLPDLPPSSARQKKGRKTTQDKGKSHPARPARPPPPRRGTKLYLTSIPYIHRWGPRSLVLARSLAPRARRGCCDLPSHCSCFANPTRWGQPAGAPSCGVGGAWCVSLTNQSSLRYRPRRLLISIVGVPLITGMGWAHCNWSKFDHTSCSALSYAEPHSWGSNRSPLVLPPLGRAGWLTGRSTPHLLACVKVCRWGRK